MAASVIYTNVMSLNAQRNLNKNSLSLATSVQRLSSGLRVNSARDDAAGLAVGMTLESNVRSLAVQIRNEADNISTSQTRDAMLGVATDMLQRLGELAVQAQGTNGRAQVDKIGTEFSALVDALSTATAGDVTLTTTTLTSTNGASAAGSISDALGNVATSRAALGANISVSEFTIQRLEAQRESDAAARSRIMDADFAAETANLTRGQILQQAGTAMVAQANQIPNNVLSLLGG